jgi:nitronate monooxygenase
MLHQARASVPLELSAYRAVDATHIVGDYDAHRIPGPASTAIIYTVTGVGNTKEGTVAYPRIIQGGMGIAVSSWPLASEVSKRGHLGVVSSPGLDLVLTRKLQMGDIGGHLRDAFDHFPIPEMSDRIWTRYFVEGGKAPNAAFKSKPMPSVRPSQALLELIVVANFAEVFLAKRAHDGVVGINLLEKIQLPTLPSLFGAMLAGVDYVLMGAGIPRAIPAALDKLAALEVTELKLDVTGSLPGEEFTTKFDPRQFVTPQITSLARPKFLAIVSSSTLAMTLARKCTGRVDGFIVEGQTAGGHNAPPRGALSIDDAGEPIYGTRDIPDLDQIRELGLPFWLAGSYGRTGGLQEALDLGAQGIQVGTAFAFSQESGIDPAIKSKVIEQSITGQAAVFTDPYASPTGFPFKVLQVDGSLSEASVYQDRGRICDLGYLRELYRKPDGSIGYRCPAEPIEDHVAKGGTEADTHNRKCVCNGLLGTVSLSQVRKGIAEPPLITAGNEVSHVAQFLRPGQSSYSVEDVLEKLLTG